MNDYPLTSYCIRNLKNNLMSFNKVLSLTCIRFIIISIYSYTNHISSIIRSKTHNAYKSSKCMSEQRSVIIYKVDLSENLTFKDHCYSRELLLCDVTVTVWYECVQYSCLLKYRMQQHTCTYVNAMW